MTLDVLPAAPVVVLGLAAALAWGAGDFGGGLASRTSPLLGVTLFVQALGIVLAAGFWAWRGEAVPGPADIAWATAAGIAAAAGIVGLYGALAVGPMSVVAPLVGVLGASVPVVVGIALEGIPSWLVVAGIVLALVAVVLVGGATSDSGGGSRRGLVLGLMGGAGIGVYSVAVSRVADGLVFGPLFIARVVATIVFVVLIVVTRGEWRLPRPAWRLVSAVALIDLLGNASYVAATQVGDLAVATVLGSLYPVATVLLAAVVLRERITPRHAIGIGTAAIAIGCIAAGSG
ncbi:MAG: DMT family transporter [Chloroflexi bacterium]|nr:DMT family transporter [Chloroflexota bacterium]